MKIFIVVFSELVSAFAALTSPVVPNELVLIFIGIMVLKVFLSLRFDWDQDLDSILLTVSVSLIYDAGILLKFVTGNADKIADLIPNLIMSVSGAAGGVIISLLLKKLITADHRKLVKISVIICCIFYPAVCLIYQFFKTGEADGSIAVMGLTFQLPELIKAAVAVSACVTSLITVSNEKYIIYFYVNFIIACSIMVLLFREKGTVIPLIYFTSLIGYMILSSGKSNGTYGTGYKIRMVPMLLLCGFFIAVGVTKRLLVRIYPLRNTAGEHEYGLENFWFNISSRLSADGSQIVDAREVWNNSPAFQLNLNTAIKIPYCQTKTAISDYATVMFGAEFGRLPAFIITVLFLTILIRLISQSRDFSGKAAGIMLVCQSFAHLSGIFMNTLYTGVNFPFLSAGGSSAFTSFLFLTMLYLSMKDNVSQLNNKQRENDYRKDYYFQKRSN